MLGPGHLLKQRRFRDLFLFQLALKVTGRLEAPDGGASSVTSEQRVCIRKLYHF